MFIERNIGQERGLPVNQLVLADVAYPNHRPAYIALINWRKGFKPSVPGSESNVRFEM